MIESVACPFAGWLWILHRPIGEVVGMEWYRPRGLSVVCWVVPLLGPSHVCVVGRLATVRCSVSVRVLVLWILIVADVRGRFHEWPACVASAYVGVWSVSADWTPSQCRGWSRHHPTNERGKEESAIGSGYSSRELQAQAQPHTLSRAVSSLSQNGYGVVLVRVPSTSAGTGLSIETAVGFELVQIE